MDCSVHWLFGVVTACLQYSLDDCSVHGLECSLVEAVFTGWLERSLVGCSVRWLVAVFIG